ncbi:MAG: SH3 domain-containing protein [Chloroflexi bacterium]|nr:SH3 domain-containing protein [Chloroflexota bacterium]
MLKIPLLIIVVCLFISPVAGQDDAPVLGINYGPYRDGQYPGGPAPSEADITQDMALIAAKFSTLRLYSSLGIAEQVIQLANDQDLQVVIQAWIGPDRANNAVEIGKAIELANTAPNVAAVLVGSEALLRRDVSIDELLLYLRYVRQNVPEGIPVGYADVFDSWDKNPSLAEVVDFVGLHSYGFFSCQPVSEAGAFPLKHVQMLRENPAYTDKKIAIFETGWPTAGAKCDDNPNTSGSDASQAQFVRDVMTAAQSQSLDLFLFEFADEPWKCYTGGEPVYGCRWGLVDVNRNPKPAWDALSASAEVETIMVRTDDGSPANCRAEADRESSLMTTIPSGTEVNVLDSTTDWLQVQVGDNLCWVHKSLTGSGPVVVAPTTQVTVVVETPTTPTEAPPATAITVCDPTTLSSTLGSCVRADLCTGATSEAISGQSWGTTDVIGAASCLNHLLRWKAEAADQQAIRLQNGSCNIQPMPDQLEPYFKDNWALTDIAIGYFNLGMRLKAAGQPSAAREAFQTIVDNYSCAWAWDPQGWFWWLLTGAREQMP